MARHLERPPADGHRTALSRRPRILHRPDRDRRHHRRPTDAIGPRAAAGAALLSTGCGFTGGRGCAIVRCRRSVPPIPDAPAVFSIRVPQRRRDVPKSRVLAAGLLMAALVIGVAVPRRRRPGDRQEPSEEAAGGAGRRHPGARPDRDGAELAEQRLQAANSRLGYVRDDLAAARRALSGHVSSSTRRAAPARCRGSSAAAPTSWSAGSSSRPSSRRARSRPWPTPRWPSTATRPPSRTSRRPWRRWPGSRPGPRRRWPSSSRDFEKAKQVADKLAGFNTTHLVNGRFVSCPVSKPYSFVDSGAPPALAAGPTRGPTS